MAVIAIVFVAKISLFPAWADILSGRESAQADEGDVKNAQTVALLRGAINPDPHPNQGGGDITLVSGTALLPEEGPNGTLADILDAEAGTQINQYIVREGDTLSQIAEMYKVSVKTIMWANDIDSKSTIVKGQTLVILPISGIKHTIKAGDTIASIARRYKADAGDIARFNDLTETSVLTPGADILVPDGEIEAAPSSGSTGPRVRGSGSPNIKGYYTRPIAGGVKSQGLHGYNAVDLAAPVGTAILAAAAGEVMISKNIGWNGGYGQYIVIQHLNGTQTLYGHLSANFVFEGYHVEQGQIIGAVGNTGKSTGPHVHFEVRGARNPF